MAEVIFGPLNLSGLLKNIPQGLRSGQKNTPMLYFLSSLPKHTLSF
jgi:hypothetical protein